MEWNGTDGKGSLYTAETRPHSVQLFYYIALHYHELIPSHHMTLHLKLLLFGYLPAALPTMDVKFFQLRFISRLLFPFFSSIFIAIAIAISVSIFVSISISISISYSRLTLT